MRFSVWPSPTRPWSEYLEAAQLAESHGFDGVWCSDHFMSPNDADDDYPVLECWSVLAAVAAVVPRVRIGAIVTGNTYRHPAVLANMAATVDRISDGRLVMGLGGGWQENEHTAYGIHFGTVGERLRRLEEACQVIIGLFEQPRTTIAGEFYTLTNAPMSPKPVQEHVPLLIGGGGEKVTMRIAAQYADEWNIWGLPDLLAQKGQVLEAHCERLGRDAGEIQRSAQALIYLGDDEAWLAERKGRAAAFPAIVGTPAEMQDVIGAYRDAGVDEFIIPTFNLGPPERIGATLQRFSEEVAPAFR
ncbi:MAG TPA: TIGR03560 family F420-dependent LLM class oxidoreductase [Acidimicrobiales bacterium]|nr:TIGR03560 family F420-dependent LLM class oxidoreductase [Acidimicrobiales bacterium]